MRSGVACWPRMARAGSPGKYSVAQKKMTDTATTMKMLNPSRRAMSLSIVYASATHMS